MRDSRFDVGFGNWLPVDNESEQFICCENCGEEIYVGETAMELDCSHYCSAKCVAYAVGAHYITVDREEIE